MSLRSLISSSLFIVGCIFLWVPVKADDCQGKVLHDLTVKPFGNQGDVYHYDKGEVLSDVRAHRSSFFGRPSYYLSKGIGPLPAAEIELLNCHPVAHPSEGFFDPGYDLIPDGLDKKAETAIFNYQKPVSTKK